jgi:hypothetical protein
LEVVLDLSDSFESKREFANALAINALLDLDCAAYQMVHGYKGAVTWIPVYSHQFQLSEAADCVIEAMEAVHLAQKILLDEKISNIRYENEMRFKGYQNVAKSNAIKMNASNGGKRKNEAFRRAEVFVKEEWKNKNQHYNKNKSAFARDYVKIVAQKYVDSKGDPLLIKEQTISRRWLSNLQDL